MLTGTQRAELNDRILRTLSEFGRGVEASELAEHLQVTQRDMVGRLQALKRRGKVTYEHNSGAPSAAGLWAVSEEGRQIVGQMARAEAASGGVRGD